MASFIENQKILQKQKIIIPENGTPYLHFDEELYLKKGKLKVKGLEEKDDSGKTFFIVIGIISSIVIPFLIPVWVGLIFFIWFPIAISRKRCAGYQVYLEDCKDFKLQLQKQQWVQNMQDRGQELAEFKKFSLSYSSSEKQGDRS